MLLFNEHLIAFAILSDFLVILFGNKMKQLLLHHNYFSLLGVSLNNPQYQEFISSLMSTCNGWSKYFICFIDILVCIVCFNDFSFLLNYSFVDKANTELSILHLSSNIISYYIAGIASLVIKNQDLLRILR